jgi:hypothetical protein
MKQGDAAEESRSVAANSDSNAARRQVWMRRLAGAVVVGASLAFLVFQLYEQAANLKSYFSDPAVVAKVVLSGIAYGAALCFVCLAWRRLLWGWSGQKLGLRDASWIFFGSNLLKYLPSNLLHFAGRYAVTRQQGYSHGAIAWSLVAENALLVVTATGLSLWFVFPLFKRYATDLAGWQTGAILVAAGAVAALAAAYIFAREKFRALEELSDRLPALAGSMVVATLFYVGFFVVNAALFQVLLDGETAAPNESFSNILGVLSLAWMVGFITPGAPAGVGVREAVAVIGLQSIGFSGDALGAALAYRLVTLIGDGIFGLALLGLRPANRYTTDRAPAANE